jgi:NIMA-interacting peptidyl-prolyl cis-trans isomerase 1
VGGASEVSALEEAKPPDGARRRILSAMRKLGLLLFGAMLSAACTGAPPPKAEGEVKAAVPDAPATPAEKCLALATVARERKPGEPEKIGVRHVLVKHKGSKNAVDTIVRSREEACLRALEARDKVLGGADFDAIVSEYSDEKGAAERRGSLGTVERKDVVPPFADAAFELTVGQMSDVVETESGFHLILRSE